MDWHGRMPLRVFFLGLGLGFGGAAPLADETSSRDKVVSCATDLPMTIR